MALFHPHPHACAELGFLYATKDGRIRCFRYDPAQRQRNLEAAAAESGATAEPSLGLSSSAR